MQVEVDIWWTCKSNLDWPSTYQHPCKVRHLSSNVRQRQKRYHSNRWQFFWNDSRSVNHVSIPYNFWHRVIHRFVFLVVIGRPKPCHVVMWKHYSPGLFSCRSAREDNVAAHARPLILDFPQDHSVFDFRSQLHDLTPIVNLEVFTVVHNAGWFSSESFLKDEACDYTQLG